MPGQLSQDLPTWTHFEQATEKVTEDDATESVPCGPDIVADVVESVRQYEDAGYDHLYFHQIGDDQDGFLRLWESELHPALSWYRLLVGRRPSQRWSRRSKTASLSSCR